TQTVVIRKYIKEFLGRPVGKWATGYFEEFVRTCVRKALIFRWELKRNAEFVRLEIAHARIDASEFRKACLYEAASNRTEIDPHARATFAQVWHVGQRGDR